MSTPCQVQLTCASKAEADKVAKILLEQRLVVCVKQLPISSSFWWKGNIESESEILLLMESVLENFEKIETEVGKLHSYKTFVLQAFTLATMSNKAFLWLKKEVREQNKK